MKRNKMRKYLGVLLVTLVPVFSCEDYLDVKPVSFFGPDYVFSNVENATKAVMGVYSQLGGDNAYGIRISMYYPYDNDEMMGQGPGNADNERRDIAHYNAQPSNTQLANPFNQLYRGIERANICIHYIPLMEMYSSGTAQQQRELKRLYGEALALRAQFYFELVRNWGDVPAQFVASQFLGDLFLEKTDRDEIYDQILSDLELAATLVPWRTEVPAEERVKQGAVRGLRARIALAAGGYSLRGRTMQRRADYRDLYTIARNETKAIIESGQHHLNPSFQAVWKDAVCANRIEPNGEVIWEVGMVGGSSATGDSKLGYYNGPRAFGRGNSALTVLPTTFYAYDPEDTRRDVTIAPYDIDNSGKVAARNLANLVDGKYRRDWINTPNTLESPAQYFGLNWVMLRYSDVLLMFAEAENELNNGPTSEAIQRFEEVRLRAFNNDASKIGVTPGDYDGFFAAIRKERMLELCGEGVRKYDLIRWNLLEQRLTEVKAEMAALAAGEAPYNNIPATMYYTPGQTVMEWKNSFYEQEPGSAPANSQSIAWRSSPIQTTLIDVLAYGFEANKDELLPFHITTIEANPKIRQNDGYENN